MYEQLEPVTLKDGETIACGVVRGPDAAWTQRVAHLLGHKGDPWPWQNHQCLTEPLADGVEVRFHLLHRDGHPIANILTVECGGVGLFGHVFTVPAERRKHASSLLLGRLMHQFKQRGGRALYLGTGYDSAAFHIYKSHGFTEIEPRSGVMVYVNGNTLAGFERDYLGNADDPVTIEPTGWRHWATSSPLFCAALPGVVKVASAKLIGRTLTEEGFLFMIRRNLGDAGPTVPVPSSFVLRNTRTDAVVGVATWDWDRAWPGVIVADVYCHPHHWGRAGDLLSRLRLPGNARVTAYADADCPEKVRALEAHGFTKAATLPGLQPVDAKRSAWTDVVMLVRD